MRDVRAHPCLSKNSQIDTLTYLIDHAYLIDHIVVELDLSFNGL